ncbi:MAG: DUF2848 domain-containing protein [Rhodospirillales bacterium]|nr:DUF2848 domain-containing protein [Rhodospirillales bacterium]
MTPGIQHEFNFIGKDASDVRSVEINNLIIAGWTGRNVEAMEEHIAELEKIGVKRPLKTPTFYRVSVDQLTSGPGIQVIGTDTSGEAEFFILSLEDGLWVGTGSDHTDRKIETVDVTQSKQVCAKPISAAVWRLDEVADHWDQLILKSTITAKGGQEEPYQEGPVTTMRAPEDLMAIYRPDSKILAPGSLMFCGTLAVEGGLRPADKFETKLIDPALNRELVCAYEINTLAPEE